MSTEDFCVVSSATSVTLSCDTQSILLVLCTILWAIIICIYLAFAANGRNHTTQGTLHVELMVIRMPLVLPVYATLTVFAYCFPFYLPIIEFFETGMEGYCIYCFFKLVMFAVGSEALAADMIRDSSKTGCLCFKFPLWARAQQQPHYFLWMIKWGFLQFLFLRPLFVLCEGLVDVLAPMDDTGKHSYESAALQRLFAVLAALCLVAILPCIMRMYVIFSEALQHLQLGRKVLFIKGFILVWVIESNVINNLNARGGDLQGTLIRRRIFSFIVMLELTVLSLLLRYVFCFGPQLLEQWRSLGAKSLPHAGHEEISMMHTPSLDTLIDRGWAAAAGGGQLSAPSFNEGVSAGVDKAMAEHLGQGGSTSRDSVSSDTAGKVSIASDAAQSQSSSSDSSDASNDHAPTVDTRDAVAPSPLRIKHPPMGFPERGQGIFFTETVSYLQTVLAVWLYIFDEPTIEANASLVSSTWRAVDVSGIALPPDVIYAQNFRLTCARVQMPPEHNSLKYTYST